MRNYKMIIAYDGSRYKGWQRQNLTNLTIQTILERTVEQMVGYPVEIDGSGRTDAGVHANGQVANMKVLGLLDESFVGELNCLLPEDIHYGGNDAEIYLECEDLDAFVKLLNSRTDTKLLHPVKEHDWGQRGIRFYDPDMHIIEVSEPLPVVVSRFTQQGMSPSQISEKMGLSERMVNRMLKRHEKNS